ncbi:MAG: nucleotide exchange factor GrpE [Chloroflexi bacterium]|nr:nucleotide exchange factor GrpE [Chloroflexota bacterium]
MSIDVGRRLRQWLAKGNQEQHQPASVNKPAVQATPATPSVSARPDEAGERTREPAPLDVAGLEKQIAKLGREQFKLNAFLEAQQQQVQSALQQLREQGERRDQEYASSLVTHRGELAEARLQVVQRLFPVLDGLDEALAAGERLLARLPGAEPNVTGAPQPANRTPKWVITVALPIVWLASLRGEQIGRAGPMAQVPDTHVPSGDIVEWRKAYVSWLRGLQIVRDRLRAVLSTEGVQPIQAVQQPFDPRLHVALDTVAANPGVRPGTVVAETQRGYVTGDRVLRYAEVIVAREAGASPDSTL